jgi:hypothetical protein
MPDHKVADYTVVVDDYTFVAHRDTDNRTIRVMTAAGFVVSPISS